MLTRSLATLGVAAIGFLHASDGTLMQGASVCVESDTGSRGCSPTGADGAFSVRAPSYDLSTLTFQKDGYVPGLRPIATQTGDVLLPEGENTLIPSVNPETFMGTATDPTKGHVRFQVMAAGATTPPALVATLTASDGSAPPAVYLDATGSPVTAASGGTAGGFANIEPGLYVLRFSGASATSCAATGAYGYPLSHAYQNAASGPAILVPVQAGTITAPVGVTCTP
jgi:hypothetical protein